MSHVYRVMVAGIIHRDINGDTSRKPAANGFCVGECDDRADAMTIWSEACLIHRPYVKSGLVRVAVVQVTR